MQYELLLLLLENINILAFMCGWLLRCSTASGSGTGFSLVGPIKVKACKSILFVKSSLVIWKNKTIFYITE